MSSSRSPPYQAGRTTTSLNCAIVLPHRLKADGWPPAPKSVIGQIFRSRQKTLGGDKGSANQGGSAMSGVCLLRASVAMAALCAMVAGCTPTAPPQVQYHNVDHPNYSTADF